MTTTLDASQSNLDPYNRPNLPPVLRWNNDLMIGLAFETKW